MNLDYQKLAKQIVKSMRISQKKNPGIKKARKKYGKFIDVLLKQNEFRIEKFNKNQQKIIKEMQKFEYGPLVYKTNKIFCICDVSSRNFINIGKIFFVLRVILSNA